MSAPANLPHPKLPQPVLTGLGLTSGAEAVAAGRGRGLRVGARRAPAQRRAVTTDMQARSSRTLRSRDPTGRTSRAMAGGGQAGLPVCRVPVASQS